MVDLAVAQSCELAQLCMTDLAAEGPHVLVQSGILGHVIHEGLPRVWKYGSREEVEVLIFVTLEVNWKSRTTDIDNTQGSILKAK